MATGSNDEEATMDEENKSDDEAEERLNMLKLEKMKAKTSFTKTKNQLLVLLNEFDLPSRQDIMEACEKLEAVHERAFLAIIDGIFSHQNLLKLKIVHWNIWITGK